MAPSLRAVFLSYASEDGAAAARICEALRSAGIEVWFDQSELRGGDAWDSAIRNQIKSCALFIAVISGSTRARGEGYFRLEWKLAIDRSHLMANDVPFLVPVSIDNIGDGDTRVPDRFRELQWTRLPGGQTPPQFVARIRTLLEQLDAAPADRAAPIAAQQPNLGSAPGTAAVAPRRGVWLWLVAVAAVVIIGVGFWAYHRLGAASSSESSTAFLDAAIPDKSIAVLPFENMSADKDQEYFSDGLAEEVIDQLTKIPDLRVPARTSSFSFKGKPDDIAVIARKLRVANILEGSVRKSGDRLRVTANLIRANNGYHLWSETYDRDLKDVFKVQDDIAGAVVSALKLKLAARSSGSQTSNPDAYNQYLLGRELDRVSNFQAKQRALAAFVQAVALDPGYADAYAAAGDTQFWVADRTADAPGYARAFTYVQKAIELAPDAAEGYLARGFLKANRNWDWVGARSDYQKALELDPGSARARSRLGALLYELGRNAEGVAQLKRAIELDPLSSRAWNLLANALIAADDYAGAQKAAQRALEIAPDGVYVVWGFGLLQLLQHRPQDALVTIRKLEPGVYPLMGTAMAEYDLGHAEPAQSALQELSTKHAEEAAYQIADAFAWFGDKDRAFEWLQRAYDQRDSGMASLKVDPLLKKLRGDPRYLALLSKMNLAD